MHLSTTHFAERVGICERVARKAFLKGLWRGFKLPVAQAFGPNGKVWALSVDRCPEELKAKLGVFEGPFEAPFEDTLNGAVEAWQWEEQTDRLRIIAPVLDLEKRSAERASTFRVIVAGVHLIRGVPTRLAETTICDWVRLHELHGPAGLIPALRGDKGKARVLFTREWDAGIDLPLDRRASIATRLAREARSMVGVDGTSIREALRLSSDLLCHYSAEAGSAFPVRELRPLCQLNTKWAERADLERFRLHYRARKNHKAYQD